MTYKRPAYPPVLTKAHWDKNKGLVAKMAGATGVGDALAKLEKVYAAVDWKKFEIADNRPNQAEFTLKKLEAMQNAAVAEMKGNAAKLRTECFAVRDLAKKAGAQFKANKLTKGAADLCEEIAKAADFMGVGVNPNSLGSYIEQDVKNVRTPYDVTFNAIKNKLPQTIAALEKAVKAVSEPPTEASWKAQHMMTKCRDLNQLIGNIPKLTEKGYDVGMDTGAANAFFQLMKPFAAQDAPFDDKSPAEAKKAKATVLALVQKAKTLR